GQPVQGTDVFGMGSGASAIGPEDSNDAIATIENVNPDESRPMDALNYKRNLGLKFQLDPPYDPARVITIVVQPLGLLKGRLLDANEPIIRASISPSYTKTDSTGNMQHNF